MTYPGLVLLVGVGVGIATFLYYVFTENNRPDEQYSYRRNRRSSGDHYEDRSWSTSSHPDENVLLNRRSSSNASKSKERRDMTTSKDDINCSICQYELVGLEVIQLDPCGHIFHKDCINRLTKYDSGAPCPNCRTKFRSAI